MADIKNTVIIGLGSNIEPERNIVTAREILQEKFGIIAESQFLKTKPVGYLDQADFINGAVLIKTGFDKNELDSILKKIERDLGREKSVIKSGPRVIDLDILVWNGKIIDQDFYKRDFIKHSVLELLPALEY